MRFSFPWRLASLALTAWLALPAGMQAQNPVPVPVAVQLPTGDYVVAIQNTDTLPAPFTAGEWHILFEPGGSYRLIRNGAVVVMGEYRTVGDTLRLVDKVGTMACTTGPATYMWKADADGGLTLMAVEDQCVGRQRLTTLRPLVRVKKD